MHREEFFTEHLPEIFRQMQTLGINIDEIQGRYQDFINN
jgi:hypothetical protein